MGDPISPDRRRWTGLRRSSSDPVDDVSGWAPTPGGWADDGRRSPRSEPEGPPPAEPPRAVPDSLTGGALFPLLLGALFIAVGTPFVVIGSVGLLLGNPGMIFLLFPAIHVAVGSYLLVTGLRTKRRRRRIAAEGYVAVATIVESEKTSKLKINGRKANLIRYHYEVNGEPYEGRHMSMKDELARFVPDDRLWVVYDPDRPDHSVEWPPT